MEKLIKSGESHCVGPQRKMLKISAIRDAEKKKWNKWREKMLASLLLTINKIDEDEDIVVIEADEKKIIKTEQKIFGNLNYFFYCWRRWSSVQENYHRSYRHPRFLICLYLLL